MLERDETGDSVRRKLPPDSALQLCALVAASLLFWVILAPPSRAVENCYTCKAATCPDPVLVLFIITLGRGSLIEVLDDCQDIREVKGHGRTEKRFPSCLAATLWQAW